MQHLHLKQGADALDMAFELELVLSKSSHARVPVQENEPSIEFKFEVKCDSVPPALIASARRKWNAR